MCTRFIHLYTCGHYTISTVSCAQCRSTSKCTTYKEKEVDQDYDCDACEEAAAK